LFKQFTHNFRSEILSYLILFFGIVTLFGLNFYTYNSRGLWLDETLTYWFIASDFTTLIERIQNISGSNYFYYSFLYFFSDLFGYSELILRLPSAIALIFVCILLYKILLQLLFVFNKDFYNEQQPLCSIIALFAVLAFLGHPECTNAFSARPYSFALLFTLASYLTLLHVLLFPTRINIILFVSTSVLLIYTHFLFLSAFILHATTYYIIKGKKLAFKDLLKASVYIFFCCVPLLPNLISLINNRHSLSFTKTPSFLIVLKDLLNIQNILFIFYTVVTIFIFQKKKPLLTWRTFQLLRTRGDFFLLLLVWWASAPILFFLLSWIFSIEVYHPRYCSWYILGYACFIAITLAQISHVKAANYFIYLLFITISSLGIVGYKLNYQQWDVMFLKLQTLPQLISKKDTPIFLYSGLIESKNPLLLNDRSKWSYFNGPGEYYLPQHAPALVPLPPSFESQVHKEFFKTVLEPLLVQHQRFFLVTQDRFTFLLNNGEINCTEYFENYFKTRGFTVQSKSIFERAAYIEFIKG
jgi:hypothetical protein